MVGRAGVFGGCVVQTNAVLEFVQSDIRASRGERVRVDISRTESPIETGRAAK